MSSEPKPGLPFLPGCSFRDPMVSAAPGHPSSREPSASVPRPPSVRGTPSPLLVLQVALLKEPCELGLYTAQLLRGSVTCACLVPRGAWYSLRPSSNSPGDVVFPHPPYISSKAYPSQPAVCPDHLLITMRGWVPPQLA